ncbi:MAG: amino acid-binding protein [Candidatus Aquicultor primus]|uniref:Amino acid-binding protein n=1 Tax=Candidatus Aquicultor primus TaxID=1797195 RepID=A0A1F2US29_9ACTN|nr:MAG: amino acid-binding protein [Candidatus Aquicultor primus]
MKATQLSVFLENKKGRLADVTKVLGENGINIRTLFIADSSDFGILRMIVNDAQKALDVLKANNFTVKVNEVVAVEVPDEPGSLSRILSVLDDNGMNVEYLYCFVDKNRNAAIDIMRVEDSDKAIEVMRKANLKILSEAELSAL